MEVNDGLFLGVERSDLVSPCKSLISNSAVGQYSDISDWEDNDGKNINSGGNKRLAILIYWF